MEMLAKLEASGSLERVAALAGGGIRREVDVDRVAGVRPVPGVGACAADDGVVAAGAFDVVVAIPAVERVGRAVADDLVVERGADDVVAGPGHERDRARVVPRWITGSSPTASRCGPMTSIETHSYGLASTSSTIARA